VSQLSVTTLLWVSELDRLIFSFFEALVWIVVDASSGSPRFFKTLSRLIFESLGGRRCASSRRRSLSRAFFDVPVTWQISCGQDSLLSSVWGVYEECNELSQSM